MIENSTFSRDVVKWIGAEQLDEVRHIISINQSVQQITFTFSGENDGPFYRSASL